jgi:uncharacterized damage-inducible protein DinB
VQKSDQRQSPPERCDKNATVIFILALLAPRAVPQEARQPSAEYAQHLASLGKLAVAVAEAMPPEEYDFRPDPPSMSFGEQMEHIAQTNFGYCAGLKDTRTPAKRATTGKDAVVQHLRDSFDYCSGVIPGLNEQQLNAVHSSPDGKLRGREIILAFYVHVAHHRGQAEVYLRDKGIKPPSFIF